MKSIVILQDLGIYDIDTTNLVKVSSFNKTNPPTQLGVYESEVKREKEGTLA